ncbi:MFS transporter [Nitrosomonas sp. Is37]|uniref:MFS transporter n=1 Tax=Nitrosomonas sp. Is37 TaxID=3080535 RepID=UPI00294AE60B|nr:MFS transporter [Nitrosomonas sp. Is37]MDV6344220.1 MFS transporter [Nitrosomonas sp. Is37]
MPNTAIAPNQATRLIHILFAIQLVSMGAMEMSGPFWPIHLKALSSSDSLFSFASVAVYVGPMLGIMLTSAFWGRIGDRYGHKLMMIRALLGLSLTQLALAYATDVWTILVLRFVQGACAGYIAPAQAYGVSIESPLRRARLFAYLQVSTNVGSLAGAIAGGLILDHATFFWINFVAAILCAICAIAVALSLPNVAPLKVASPATQPADAPVNAGSLSLWRSSPIFGLLIIIGLLLMSRMLTQAPFALYVRAVLEVSNWVVGLCYGLLAAGFVVSASLWARYFEEKTLSEALCRMIYIVLACITLMAAAGATRSIGVFITIYFAWGILLGATTPVLMSLVSRAADSLQQGRVLGIAQSTVQFSSIAGIALGGWLMQIAVLESTYFFVSFAYALAVIAVLAMRRSQVAVQRS